MKDDEKWKIKDYLRMMTMSEARGKFSLRSKMFLCKMNYSNDPKNRAELWKCDSCKNNIDTQSHMLWCESYRGIRENLKSLNITLIIDFCDIIVSQ